MLLALANRPIDNNPTFTTGGDVSFYFDYRTKWVTNTKLDPILVATGDFQSELGCPTDDDATCMRSWLQDPDRDGTYAFTTIDIPAGRVCKSIWQERMEIPIVERRVILGKASAGVLEIAPSNVDCKCSIPRIHGRPTWD